MDLYALAGTVIAGLVACYLLESYFLSKRASSEPFAVRPRIPLVGHLISLMDNPSAYYMKLNARMPGKGSFTIIIFGFKLYGVTDRKVVLAIQRAAKSISFVPFSQRATVTLAQMSPEAEKVVKETTAMAEMKAAMNHGMLAGHSLDALNLVMIQEDLRSVESLVSQVSEGNQTVDLHKWVKHSISLAASDAWYGPKNPFHDPEHESDYWTFKDAFPMLVANILPKVFASKGAKAQQGLLSRYEEYAKAGGLESASSVVQQRSQVLQQHGMPMRDVARINAGNDAALLGNLYPVAFWNIYNIITRPDLLQDIRAEVAKAVMREDPVDSSDTGPTYTLDISILRTACPLLVSAFQETQRLQSFSFQIREVLRDTTVVPTDSKREILFRQGGMVQISGMPALHSKDTWGPDADEYDGYRFIRLKKDPDSKILKPSDLPSGAFPVWGIAPHVCPARQFATTGCMALAALLILRLDIKPDGDTWVLPKLHADRQSMAMPREPVPVRMKARDDWNQGIWKVAVGQPETRLPLAVT